MAAASLQHHIGTIKKTLLAGAFMAGTGIGILALFKPALDQARLFENETAKFTMYGMGDRANAEAVKYAKSMDIFGTSSVQAMKLITEAQGVFRESGALNLQQQLVGAKIAAPVLAKLNFIESSLSADTRTAAHAQDLAMLRFIEARGGANNPQQFASIADWGFRLSKSSGEIVDWAQLQQFTATAGAAGFNLTQDAITKLEPVLADLKGGRTGSGLRVAFQRLMGTQRGLPKQAVQEYLSLGLWDPTKLELNKQGGIARFLGRPGEVLKGRDQLATDPVAYFLEKFLPAISKKYGPGILGDSVKARTERAVEESLVFGPGTAGAVISQIDKLMPAIARSLAAQGKQLGIDQSYGIVGKTLSGKEQQLHARFNTLLEQTGEVALPIVVQALETILPILQSISKAAQMHPTGFKLAIEGIIGLGIALTASGVITGLVGLATAVQFVGRVFAVSRLITVWNDIGVLAYRLPLLGRAISGFMLTVSTLRIPTLAALGSGLLTLWNDVGVFAARIPLIGGMISGLMLSVGPALEAAGAAITAAVAGVGIWIVPIIAAVAAVGAALFFIVKDWDASRGVFDNIKVGLADFWTHLVALARKIPLIGGLIPKAHPTPAASVIPQYAPNPTYQHPTSMAQAHYGEHAFRFDWGQPPKPGQPRPASMAQAHYGEHAFNFGKAWTAFSSAFDQGFRPHWEATMRGFSTVWSGTWSGIERAIAGTVNWIAGTVPAWKSAWSAFAAAIMAPINWIADKAKWLHDRMGWLFAPVRKEAAINAPGNAHATPGAPKKDFWSLFGTSVSQKLSDGLGLTAWEHIFSSLGADQKKSSIDVVRSNHALADAMSNLSKSFGAAQPARKSINFVAPSQAQTNIHHITVKVGNREVAKEVAKTLTRSLTGPAHGTTGSDPSAVMAQVGSRYTA